MRLLVPLLSGVLALAGCGSPAPVQEAPIVEYTPAPEITPPAPALTTTKSVAEPPTEPAETGGGLPAFVSGVQDTAPEIAVDRRDEEISDIARQVCASLAAGRKAAAVVTETRTLGTNDANARKLIRLAIGTVCTGQAGRTGEF